MGEYSKIEWTDCTFNPWWGCTKVSSACQYCYAEMIANRYKTKWGDHPRRLMAESTWEQPLAWNRRAEREGRKLRVFCGSMCDVFEDREELAEPRARLVRLMRATPYLFWLLLTKRPENTARMLEDGYCNNVGLGVTVENQQYADERIPKLLQIPAALHFVSCEPLLGPVDLGLFGTIAHSTSYSLVYDRIGWVIAGGESGAKARPSHPDWFRSLRDQCAASGVPFLLKQMNIDGKLAKSPLLDSVQHLEIPGVCR